MKDLNYAGSQWAKWDLHIHSNASDGNGTPQQIIEKAKEKGLSVIALTDHHTVKNIDEIKKLGNENNITVISGIEFRTEYGSKSVHMIGLFPDEYNGIKLTQQALNDLILVPLNLSETIIKTKGKEEDSALTDEENNLKALVADKKQRIKVIESDVKYVNGEKYYKENETIKQMSIRLSEERKKEERLTKINTKQTEIIEQISLSKERIFEKQRMYYELGQQICGQIQLEKDELSIMPKLSYNQEKLQMFVDSYLNARNPLAKAMQEADIIDNESLINVLTNAFDNIVKGIVPLKGGKDKKQAAVELLSTNYYYFMYNVVYQGDTLSSMSEGKKAFVILRLLLDFDENKYPILIDQPEDDLDNRAIYNDLVTYIRNKKLERQIILVTHNPNITVGTDAEEIIVANQHGAHTENQDGVKFEYRSGAIENSYKRDGTKTVLLSQGIREHVCDLLEGGDIAFKKRESKYGLKK